MEATVVCVDNSEWTRSGDYAPTRFQSQADAVNLLAGAKTEANAENTVGVLTMAGKNPKVLVTPTPDLGRILNSMQELRIEGECNFASSMLIAQLALKHRQNKNQRQRIVLFVGSPITVDKAKFVRIAKKLKKNNVAVDIVSFGSEEENAEKLEAFLEAVNSGDNSHLVTVPAGTVLSDSLFGSPVFQQEGGGGYGAAEGEEGGAQREGYEFGVDPNLDPELAMALRVSLEEERARQVASGGAPGGPDAATQGQDAAGAAAARDTAGAALPAGDPMEDDALLQEALAMSMQEEQAAAAAAPLSVLADAAAAETTTAAAPEAALPEDMDMDGMDEDLRAALQMSMQEVQPGEARQGAGGASEKPAGTSEDLNDPAYLSSVLGSLPGVDVNDPSVQAALNSSQQQRSNASDTDKANSDKEGKK
ncbi:hypothetical protein WJX73_003916 [Symbiochloris irregularis]|uniref:26S proteasome non-ATPase regulatory subunit 4 homolog n=1 Tax=Symbiochloris irregularis TaxID=706552 RepID=A0AAW1PTS5_9CHLO